MRRNFSLKVGLFLFSSLVPVTAWATAVVVPGTAQPGRVEQQLRIDDERPTVGGASIITVPDDNGGIKNLKEGATFKLKGVSIENATAFSSDELAADYSSYVGKEVSLRTLNEIANKITVHYRNAGYILSRAVLPPQRVTSGVIKIKIVEGYVNKVLFEGKDVKSGLLAEYADKIRSAKPLDAATLERYLLLMEDLPGVRAYAVLRPAQGAPGASDVVITINDKMVDGSVTLDNRGTRYLGPVQGGLTANINNALGWYDKTSFRGILTGIPNELQFFQFTHEEQLDSEGTKLSVSAGRTATRPGFRLRDFQVVGIDTIYSAQISHPFIRSRQTNLYGNTQFDIRNTDTRSLGSPLFGDRLRVLRAGGSYDFMDSMNAINRVDGQVSKGFGWGDDTTPFVRSRSIGHTNFYKFAGQANRLQPISGPWGAYFATTGQLASDALLSAEQFGIGGANFGSAYDPSEITGDSGIAGRAELQYSRSGDFELVPSYQLYGFYDIGEVWTRHALSGQKKTQSLASTGLGVRFNVLDPISGNLEVAVPLTKDVAANGQDGDSARVFFSLAYRY